MNFKPIPINRQIPYADNLANAINEYWREQVALPDGTRSTLEGNVVSKSVNGVPVQVIEKRRVHPAIIRVKRGPRNTWIITSKGD